MFNSIHHISYTVSDIDRSVAFYRGLLNFKLIHVVERRNVPSYDTILGYPNVEVRIAAFELPGSSGITLELMQFRNPRPLERDQDFRYVTTSHVAYLVDDIDAEYTRIQSQGGRFISEVAEIRREGKYIGKAVFLLDPDGILIEPMQLAEQ